jgi:hypothetical protein
MEHSSAVMNKELDDAVAKARVHEKGVEIMRLELYGWE